LTRSKSVVIILCKRSDIGLQLPPIEAAPQ
jgi:hypothetical protein